MNQAHAGCRSSLECQSCGVDRFGESRPEIGLRTRKGIRSSRARWGSGIWPVLCGALFLAVPKCPLCLAAWLGALGVVGGGAALHGPLRAILASAFLVALFGFAISVWRRKDGRPLIVGRPRRSMQHKRA